MVDHAVKEVIVNIQWVIQIPRSRIESFNTFRLVPSERDSMKSLITE